MPEFDGFRYGQVGNFDPNEVNHPALKGRACKRLSETKQ